MSEPQFIPLVQAAARMRISWGRCWRLVLMGKLVGRQEEGHWFVEEQSVRAWQNNPHPPAPPSERVWLRDKGSGEVLERASVDAREYVTLHPERYAYLAEPPADVPLAEAAKVGAST